MAILKVNPNRMELLKLKKRTEIARRGYKLLKDKLDELMKHFLAIVRKIADLREKVEQELVETYRLFALVRTESSKGVIEEALSYPRMEIGVDIEKNFILNVAIPQLTLSIKGTFDCYSLTTTPSLLDDALFLLKRVLSFLIELAQVEKTAEVLAREIEKTRRRVNALEYILIPSLEETINFITMKLDEIDRESRTRLMKIKEMVSE